MADFHIAISVDTQVPSDIVTELRDSLSQGHVDVIVETREPAAFAIAEWAIPTLVMIFLSRKLFDAFMGELGKDLYALVKRSLLHVVRQTTGSEAQIHATYVLGPSSARKVSGARPAVVSVTAMLNDGVYVRFFFTDDLEVAVHELAVAAMIDIVQNHYSGRASDSLSNMIPSTPSKRDTIVPLLFDREQLMWRLAK